MAEATKLFSRAMFSAANLAFRESGILHGGYSKLDDALGRNGLTDDSLLYFR